MEEEEIKEENLEVREQTEEDDNEIGNIVDLYYKLQKNSSGRGNIREKQCYDLVKQLSQYLYLFSFSFLLFSDYCFSFIFSFLYFLINGHIRGREVQNKREGLGLLFMYKQYTKSNRNSIEFSLSITDKRAVGLILAQELAH